MNLSVLLSYARPYRASLMFCLLLMLLGTATSLAVPWLGGLFAGGVLSQAQVNVKAILLGLLALFAAQASLSFVRDYVLTRTTAHIVADLRARIYDHLQALPLDFYHQRRQGDILALITYEVGNLSSFITGTLLRIVPLLLTAVGSVVLMFWIEPIFAVLVAVLIPVFYLVVKIMSRRFRPLAVQLQEANATALAYAEEDLGMLPAIKAFTREAEQSWRYRNQTENVRVLSTTLARLGAALNSTLQFLAAAAAVLLLWLASARVSEGDMTTAELVSFFLYAVLLTRPVSALAGVYGQTQLARGALKRMQDVMTEDPEPILGGRQALAPVHGDIEFRDVSFAYPGRPPALRDVNLHIRAGETVALTGENGAGKSSLAHLLMRLHELDTGQILIDGTDITSVSLHSLRSQIGLVPQHVLLLNGSVRTNIGYGKPDATPTDIERAAQAAQAHDFINRLPDGYETLIGDQGIKLSGGQRQRIALARALLKDPQILILDEPTAMFDPQGEIDFVEQCHQTLSRRTVLLITHRPTSLSLADRVIKLHAGGIVSLRQVLNKGRGPGGNRATSP